MKLHIKIFVLLLCLGWGSCSWLDIEPEGEATEQKLNQTGDGYRTQLGGVYSQMASAELYGVDLQFGYIDCLSQQYDWSWKRNAFGQNTAPLYQRVAAFEYQNDAVRSKTDQIWESGYNVIANANNLINHISVASSDIFEYGEMERSLILGEAYACRALMHFDLCRLFAPAPIEQDNSVMLPYVTTFPNPQPEGIDLSAYLSHVVEDFEKAATLTLAYDSTELGTWASASWMSRFAKDDHQEHGFNNKLPSGEKPDALLKRRGYHLSYHAIKALLARVYLYMGDYDKALEYAQSVWDAKAKGVSGSGVELDMYKSDAWYDIAGTNDAEQKRNLRQPWNIIFALHNDDAYNKYQIETYFKKTAHRDTPKEWFLLALKGQDIFLNRHTSTDEYEQDYRGQFMTFTPNSDAIYGAESQHVYSLKLFPSENTDEREKSLGMSPVIRASEMQYIIAECHARKGNFTEAYNILNQMRQTRGLFGAQLPTAGDLKSFFKDLVNDAQREWISEGQLFYLYKRLKFPCIGPKGERRPMNKSEYMPPIPINQNF